MWIIKLLRLVCELTVKSYGVFMVFFSKRSSIWSLDAVLQVEKCCSDAFEQMYDFCPLDLFSGDLERMRKAITSLIIVPHRNLRIFLDGTVIHSDELPLEIGQLKETLFSDGSVTVEQLTTAASFLFK